jgi:hypothetical protein
MEKINNMSYYRIKIDELQNGEKRYVPEKGELHVYGGWIKKQEIRWYNIGDRYFDETQAMIVIHEHKKAEEIKRGTEVKSTTYKMID